AGRRVVSQSNMLPTGIGHLEWWCCDDVRRAIGVPNLRREGAGAAVTGNRSKIGAEPELHTLRNWIRYVVPFNQWSRIGDVDGRTRPRDADAAPGPRAQATAALPLDSGIDAVTAISASVRRRRHFTARPLRDAAREAIVLAPNICRIPVKRPPANHA